MTRDIRIKTALAGLSITAVAAALLAIITPDTALAQVGDINSTSGSNSEANSGSQSGAASDQTQAQQANNYGIGNSQSESGSEANANSGSVSGSSSDQGQSQGQSLSNQLGQSASNSQGVAVSNTFNSYDRKKNEFRTNAPVPLAASSSFSTDYCGGTASGGASAAPLGISIGAAAPVFDKSCQSLRRAEKFGMAAANYNNLGYPDEALKMMSLMVWSICTSDSAGPRADKTTATACETLLGSQVSPPSPPPAKIPEPAVSQSNGQPTPEAVERYKTPRGDLQFDSQPVIQAVPIAAVALP